MYSLSQTPRTSDVDMLIEELRRNRLAEEQIKKKQQAKEQTQKALYDKLQVKSSATPSYDISGKAVSVQQLKMFPSLVPTCINKINHQKTKEVKTARDLVNAMIPKTVKKGPIKVKEEHEKRFAIYDKIIPATGVTFTEIGKAPKISNLTISQSICQLAKSNYLICRHPQTKTVESPIKKERYDEEGKKEVEETARSITKEVKVPYTSVKARVSENIKELLISNENTPISPSKSILPSSYPVYKSNKNSPLTFSKHAAMQMIDIESQNQIQNAGKPIKKHSENSNKFSYGAFFQTNGI